MNIGRVWRKVLDFFGLHQDLDQELEESVENIDDKRIVSIYKKQGFRIIIHNPESFSEVKGIVDQLKSSKPIVLNLQRVDKNVSRRIIDFISGAVYGVEGNMEKIAESVFVFTPRNVELDGQELKESKSLFS